MTTRYKCKRCLYETSLFKDLIRHYHKNTICVKKNIESNNYTDDQLIVLSLLPYHNDKHTVSIKEIEHLNGDILYKDLNNYINCIDCVYKNKNKVCEFCNVTFKTLHNLRKHIIITCYHKNLLLKKNIFTESSNNINKNKCVFENATQIGILLTNMISTSLLKELLNTITENEDNKNILIEKLKDNLISENELTQHIIVDKVLEDFFSRIKNENIKDTNKDISNK